ncbi:MAG: response regulator [bacterium]|nr:response regulator [bacterium]
MKRLFTGTIVFMLCTLSVVIVGCSSESPPEPEPTAVPTVTPATSTSIYNEAPQLAELVAAGGLPPIHERLPKNPMLVQPVKQIGRYGGTWHMGMRSRGADQAMIIRTIGYENLVRWNEQWTQIMPNIAQFYEANDTATEFSFRLREGMRWSDGVPFTVDDILFWYENILLNQELNVPIPDWLTSGGEVVKVEKVDDDTVIFRFAAPKGLFLQELAQPKGRKPTSYPRHYLEQFHIEYNPNGIDALMQEAGVEHWTELFKLKVGQIDTPGDPDTFVNTEIPTLNAWALTQGYTKDAREVLAERNPYYWKVDVAGKQLPYITPLNAILGFTRVMAHNVKIPPEEHDHLSIIQRSGDHLLTLINQVLDLSKIEAGRITLNESNVDLHGLLSELEDMFRIQAQSKALHLVFDCSDDLPHAIRTDEVKLRQVLINLLNNAMKFTKKGGITVSIAYCRLRGPEPVEGNSEECSLFPSTGSGHHNLQCSISDTGPGIVSEELDMLFEAFSQTETGRQAREGTGLGLTISQKFVQLMGGDITVRSDVGHGTTVAFTIHAGIADAADTDTIAATRRAISLEPGQPCYRMLIADDNPDNRQLLVSLLSPFGFELREAVNGQEAVDIWEQWQPHLIWMDIRMPGMSGYDAATHIRSAARGHEPVIIAVSASTFEEERSAALLKGCHDFLRKPFRDAEIFELLHTHLGVQFVYEEPRELSSTQKCDDLPAALATLPDELLARLKEAATICDINTLQYMITEIRTAHLPLADALTDLIEGFEYTTIITAIHQSKAATRRKEDHDDFTGLSESDK